MSADSPWALPVRIDEDLPPVNIAPPTEGAGAVVALLADPGPRAEGWPARVAVSLAREWAADGLRVFLADGDLERPALHGVLGQENGEGVADAVVYGASPGRIGRPVADGGFVFAPAGTVVPDPGAAYAHPRWDALLGAFRESGSVLLLYIPAGDTTGGLLDRADRVLRLTSEAPTEDPGLGHLYVHPAEGGGAPAESPSEFVLSDDFMTGAEAGDEERTAEGDGDEVWSGSGELQITDEWAGDGPSSLAEGSDRVAEGADSGEDVPTEAAAGDPGSSFADDPVRTGADPMGPAGREPSDLAAGEPEALGGTDRDPAGDDPDPGAGEAPEAPADAGAGMVAGAPRSPVAAGRGHEPRDPAPVERSPQPAVRSRPAKRSLRPWLLLLLVLVLAAVLAADWLGYIAIPGLSFAPSHGEAGLAGAAPPTSAGTG